MTFSTHDVSRSGRQLRTAACLALLLSAVQPVSAALALDYPGPDPGPARVERQGDVLAAGNAALSMSWTVKPPSFKPRAFRQQQLGRDLPLAGEVFEIALADGHRYAASQLVPEGEPQITALTPDPQAARLATRLPGRQIAWPMRSADGMLRVVWRAVLLDGANYVRQEIELTAARDNCVVQDIVWMNESVPGARSAGTVDGSPVVAEGLFLGCEDPHALNRTVVPDIKPGSQHSPPDTRVHCRLLRNAPLAKGTSFTQSFVIGVAPPGQLRRAFLYYLERERAHPYRPFLHYNSWYDIATGLHSMNESNCLDAIRTMGEKLVQPHGVVLDAMVFDDGWDDPKTLWHFHSGFPNGFGPHAELCRQYGTHVGVWLSPFGGYGKAREERLKYGREQGFEINPTGFSLAGPKYYAAFKDACVRMMQKYGVNHFKFDGIAAGTYASGGATYVLDTEAMRRLMLDLRQENPQVYINLTTGSWPSPFWLRYADSVWRQGGDMGLAGKGPRQQQWLTYRDRETYRNIAGKGPLYPLNALMTQGVAYSRHGTAGDPTFNAAGFKDDVRAFFGAGTSLQELYIQPGKLTDDDWQVLAEAAKWSRGHADVLADTHWIGGDPAKLEVYGYASWTPRKGIVMLRNPDEQPHEFALDVGAALELPPGAATQYQLKSPWAHDAQKPAISATAGQPVRITLLPFQVLVFEATPEVVR